MAAVVQSDIRTVGFEPRDADIFRIPDVKTRLATLQGYFFPRLKVVRQHALELVREIYGAEALAAVTDAQRPAHRTKALENIDYGEVYVGLCAKELKGASA